ncbi:MAG: hypothetical protein NT160_06360 [Actinobacteria bacterium]|nr:hypothetical protein [Actinomycetota bacterium]
MSPAMLADALQAKRAFRQLLVSGVQRCTRDLAALKTAESSFGQPWSTRAAVAEAMKSCAVLRLAQDPLLPDGAPGLSHDLDRDLEIIATGSSPQAQAATARLETHESSLAFAVSRVILDPPSVARRAQRLLEWLTRACVPKAQTGGSITVAANCFVVGAQARAALETLLPLVLRIDPALAAHLEVAMSTLAGQSPEPAVHWRSFAIAADSVAGFAAKLVVALQDLRQGGSYV